MQLGHVRWEGFHFEDLIFPMFVYIVGVSLVFSLRRTIEQKGRAAAVVRIFRRAAALFLLGIFYYGGFSTTFVHIRLLGVLQRIALAYLGAGLIFVFLRTSRPRRVVRGPAHRLLGGDDLHSCTGHCRRQTSPPAITWPIGSITITCHCENGTATMIPKGCSALCRRWPTACWACWRGCCWAMTSGPPGAGGATWGKAAALAAAGAVAVGLGWLWSLQFPVIKQLWTSSFVLVACGYSSLLLAAFYMVVDIFGWQRWAAPFIWIGMNPIADLYAAQRRERGQVAGRIVGGDLGRLLGNFSELAVAIVGLLLTFGFAWFLYRRKIFLRV